MRQYVVSRFVVFRPSVIVSVIVSPDSFATPHDNVPLFVARSSKHFASTWQAQGEALAENLVESLVEEVQEEN